MTEFKAREHTALLLGWVLAAGLIITGWIDNNHKTMQMMDLLKDNIASKMEYLENRTRLDKIEADLRSRQNRRWLLPDQVNWSTLLQQQNPTLNVPPVPIPESEVPL